MAVSFEAPFSNMDELCISCGSDDIEYNSNLCSACQKKLGVKRLGAESFSADSWVIEAVQQNLNDKDFVDYAYSKIVGGDAKGYDEKSMAIAEMMNQNSNDDAFLSFVEEELFSAESFEAEVCPCGCAMVGCVCSSSCRGECLGAESFDAESKFDKLANKIAAQYRKKGKSAKEAMRIGKATAYTIGARKYGKAGMARKARAGMRAEEFGADETGEYCESCDTEIYPSQSGEAYFRCGCGYLGCGCNTYMGRCPSCAKIEGLMDEDGNVIHAESFGAEGTQSRFPWLTMGIIGVGIFFASRIKTVNFKADCGCGCKGANAGGCGDGKDKKEAHGYPEVYDPVQDYLPKYRYPKGTSWSNAYNPAAPYRPLDYQSVHVDSNTTAKRM